MSSLTAIRTVRRSATTLAVSAAILTGFAVSPAGATATAAPSRGQAVSWSTAVFNLLNAERVANHVAPLIGSVNLTTIAHLHNVKMAAYNTTSHQLPGELPPRTRIAQAGFSAVIAGENLAQTTDWTAAGALARHVAMYTETPAAIGNRANIYNGTYRYVGVDVAVDAAHHKLWITEDFSTRPPPVAAPSVAAMATEMLRMINAERAAHGRLPLRNNSLLIRSAHGHNLHMAAANSMSHLIPGELGFLPRLLQAGYHPSYAAENIAWNSNRTLQGVLYLQTIMYNEVPPNDAHRVNMLNATYRDVGVDVYQDTAHHKVWVTQDFGLPQ
ncbi:MAG: CAP domain-containing protein [Pseudonocardiales bacterium]